MEKDKEPQMDINNENYYSKEADMEYMSASQFNGFMKCEARQKAILTGEFIPTDTTALLQGRLLETLLLEPDKIEQFRNENPELFSQKGANKGDLKYEFKKVQEMADRAKQDNFFMSYLGDPFSTLYQYPVTGEIAGITKETVSDIGIFSIPQEILDHQLSVIGELAPRYQKIKDGEIEPVRCECCDYCKTTKELNTVVNLFDY